MRFLLGVIVGYSLRGKQKLLIRFLVTLALVVYVVIPALALLELSLTSNVSAGLDQLKPGCQCSKDLPMKTLRGSFTPLT